MERPPLFYDNAEEHPGPKGGDPTQKILDPELPPFSLGFAEVHLGPIDALHRAEQFLCVTEDRT